MDPKKKSGKDEFGEETESPVSVPPPAAAAPLRGSAPLATTASESSAKAPAAGRLRVNKAYKMYVGGAFIRSESGRYFQVQGKAGSPDPETVNIPRGSRKDVRDAVLIAKNAQHGWASRTAFNRGQIMYRLAEVLESRQEELLQALVRGGVPMSEAEREVQSTVDRAVFYAGFADKLGALVASHNPVAGPHFGFSIPEPMGVVCVVAPERPALLGLVSTILPAITGGNTVVALSSDADPRAAIVLSECLATSDLPGGVINILTGHAWELSPHMARHREVISIEAWCEDTALRADLEKAGADSIKRVKTMTALTPEAWHDPRRGQGIGWIERHLETKTIWHPMGL
jgi:acyl-CoA reductase-like NAD-dependent aldehyde dehydrogenase